MKYEKNGKEEFKRRLYKFVLRLIKFVDNLNNTSTSRVIGNQLIRSGTSVLGNFIEGQSANSRKDYTNYFNHSLKSSNESKVWICLLRDTNNGSKKEAEWLLSELNEISKIFASSILTLKGKRS